MITVQVKFKSSVNRHPLIKLVALVALPVQTFSFRRGLFDYCMVLTIVFAMHNHRFFVYVLSTKLSYLVSLKKTQITTKRHIFC